MNIENLKNMPIIGQPEEVVPQQDGVELEVGAQLIDNETSRLAIAVRSFQETLSRSAQDHISNSIESRDEQDTAVAATQSAYWAASKAAFDTLHSEREAEIAALTDSFTSQIAGLLGVAGVTAATPGTVFGLIESLRLEDITWNDLLEADTTSQRNTFDTFQADMVGDIDNPLAGLDFTGVVEVQEIIPDGALLAAAAAAGA